MSKWLFVLAHPDDEADVGGTIYKLSQSGERVAVALLVSKAAARRNLSSDLANEEKRSMDIPSGSMYRTFNSVLLLVLSASACM